MLVNLRLICICHVTVSVTDIYKSISAFYFCHRQPCDELANCPGCALPLPNVNLGSKNLLVKFDDIIMLLVCLFQSKYMYKVA